MHITLHETLITANTADSQYVYVDDNFDVTMGCKLCT